MLVLKKNDPIKLLGDELYGIELDYTMLRDIERRATERRETLDIAGDLCEAYGYNRREVQEREPKTGLRDFFFARMKYAIGILTPTLS